MREATVSQSAALLLIGGFDGPQIPDELRRLTEEERLGGVILFSRNIIDLPQTAGLVADLKALGPQPLWIAVDQEGGRVARLPAPFPQFPPARTLGEAASATQVERAGKVMARALRLIGFDQTYAPVLDVDSNPDNPVIGDRAFSRDPARVAELGTAFIRGLQAGGVAACGKHFPGHGDTELDSHLALPTLAHPLRRMLEVELVPFKAAVRAGVASIMSAHIVFSAFDPELPATLSPQVLGPLLRDRLGFEGVLVSDDLEMAAIADHYGVEEAAVMAVQAGCDQLLICHHLDWVERAHGALVQAVEEGRLARARLEEAADRVRAMRAAYQRPVELAPGELLAALPDPDYEALALENGWELKA